MEPKPIQPGGIPILLACHYATGSEAQYRRAAHYANGVIAISDTPDQYAKTLNRVRKYVTETGTSATGLRTIFYITVNLNRDPDAAFREADSFIRSYYGLNFWADKWGPFGRPEDVTQRILEYWQAGAQEIIVRFASQDQLSQLQTFVQEVLPGVRQGTTI